MAPCAPRQLVSFPLLPLYSPSAAVSPAPPSAPLHICSTHTSWRGYRDGEAEQDRGGVQAGAGRACHLLAPRELGPFLGAHVCRPQRDLLLWPRWWERWGCTGVQCCCRRRCRSSSSSSSTSSSAGRKEQLDGWMKVGAPAGARSQADGEGSQSHAELPIGASVLRSACTVGEGEAVLLS